jgi:hypothetical protein
MQQRASDILAYFDRPGTSNGPAEALKGRPEPFRGSALGFGNHANHIARSLLVTGEFRAPVTPWIARSRHSGQPPRQSAGCRLCRRWFRVMFDMHVTQAYEVAAGGSSSAWV